MGREIFLETAARHLGYQARAGLQSTYGGLTGYQGLPWDGSFVDAVAKEAGVLMPTCVYPTSGLAEFIKIRRWHAKPQPGDIAFFCFSTGEDFGSPHVGIVTDVSEWKKLGRFRCIEGMISSGLPNGSPVNDGVFERTRWKHDVLGFGRPNFKLRPGSDLLRADGSLFKLRPGRGFIKADGRPLVGLSNVRPGRRNKEIERVQLALAQVTGLRNAKQGAFDGQTQAAYAQWQRQVGYVGSAANGLPDLKSLEYLGDSTQLFEARS